MGKKGKKKTETAPDNEKGDVDGAVKEANANNKVKASRKKKKNDDDNWEDDVLNEISQIQSSGTQQPDSQSEIATAKQEPAAVKTEEIKVEKKHDPIKVQERTASVAAEDPKSTSGDVSEPVEITEEQTENDSETSNKKKKKKKKGDKKSQNTEEEKPRKGKPSKAAIKVMQEALKKQKDEEERRIREEEERIRKEEEQERLRLEAIERERLKKEKKKQDQKDKIKQQKIDGTYLTPSQREAKRRREMYRESLLKQGFEVPDKEPTKKPIYERKKKNNQEKHSEQAAESVSNESGQNIEEPVAVKADVDDISDDGVHDAWEAIAEEMQDVAINKTKEVKTKTEKTKTAKIERSPPAEKERSKEVMQDLKEQKEEETSKFRSPVVCVLGHVDTGKTKILDKIRHSHVQDGEAGGITQQIGATNVPGSAILEQISMVKNFHKDAMKLPGLLIIDTPGHESFGNLRSRGSSSCDIAILVVDIMHGLEPQTIESIGLLKKNKTPFIVALNKVDRLYEWKHYPRTDVSVAITKQKTYVKEEFLEKVNNIIVQFAEQSLNVKLYYENTDPKTWISMVPTSAHSGDGMGNLMALVVQFCQSMLAKKLEFSEKLQCTVLEVKVIHGLGTTIDVLLTNGRLKYGDTIVIPGSDGPIVTNIKGLLMPQPLRELRVKNPYDQYKQVKAAHGVKILARDLEKALAGTTLLVAQNEDDVEMLKTEAQAEITGALNKIKLKERGVFVQASTLGSLEALLEFLKQSSIPYAGINIGPVCKRDVMRASVMLEHDTQWAVILAFDVKVEREAQEMADGLGVRVFTADIIYHLFDAFIQHRKDLIKHKQDQYRHIVAFPCKLKILPNCVFKSRDPIVVGVKVDAGQLRIGTPLCVPDREFLHVGLVSSIESNHRSVELARQPEEVCIKIEGIPGEAPKMVGRHFEVNDLIVSKISRDSINALKDWFRDDMTKTDWQLIIELKKLFEII